MPLRGLAAGQGPEVLAEVVEAAKGKVLGRCHATQVLPSITTPSALKALQKVTVDLHW